MARWVRWYSVKYHDGRRPSGQGYNKSKVHLLVQEGQVAACGKEVQIEMKQGILVSNLKDVCSRCRKAALSLKLPLPVAKEERKLE